MIKECAYDIQNMIEVIAESFGITANELVGKCRKANLVEARQIAMYLIRQDTDCSLLETGEYLGGRSPATVTYGYQKIANGTYQMFNKINNLRMRINLNKGLMDVDEMTTEERTLIAKNRVDPYRKLPEIPIDYPFPIPTTKDGVFAKCPKCNSITRLRVCHGCKEIMCSDCLSEHQVVCLSK